MIPPTMHLSISISRYGLSVQHEHRAKMCACRSGSEWYVAPTDYLDISSRDGRATLGKPTHRYLAHMSCSAWRIRFTVEYI